MFFNNFCFSKIFLLDKVHRKTVTVSSSTLRQRTRVDVEKRLEQIRDDYTNLTMTVETDLVDVIRGFLEEPKCTENLISSDSATGFHFSEEDGDMDVVEAVGEAEKTSRRTSPKKKSL